MASVSSTPSDKRPVPSLCRGQNRARCGSRLTDEVIQLRRPVAQSKCKVGFGLARKNSLKKKSSLSYELQERKRTTWVTTPSERIGVENKYIDKLGMNMRDFFKPVFGRVPPIGKDRQQSAQPQTQNRKQPPTVPKRPLPNAQQKVVKNRKGYNNTLSPPADFERVKAADVFQAIELQSGAPTASVVIKQPPPIPKRPLPNAQQKVAQKRKGCNNTLSPPADFERVKAADVFQAIELQSGAHTASVVMSRLLPTQQKAALDASSELSLPQALSPTQSLSGTMFPMSTSDPTPKATSVSPTANPLKRVHLQKLDKLLRAEQVRQIDVRELTAKLSPRPCVSSIGNVWSLNKDNKRKDKKKQSPDEVLRASTRPKPATKVQATNWQTSDHFPYIQAHDELQEEKLHFRFCCEPEQLPPVQVAQVLASPRREQRLELHTDEFLFPEPADFARLSINQQGTTRDNNIAQTHAERTRELYEHAQQLRGELQRRDRIDELFAVGPYRRPPPSSVLNIGQPAVGDCRGSLMHLGPSNADLLLRWFAITPTSCLYILALIILVVVFLNLGREPPLSFWEKLWAHLKNILQ